MFISKSISLKIKRFLDIILSGILLVGFSPLWIIIALAIYLEDGRPIFFGHPRVGKAKQPFVCWKFRSMVSNAEEISQDWKIHSPKLAKEFSENFKLVSDPRITKVGKILRKTSLDEFPQLWNVLKGEMSLVGPRPLTSAEIPKYGQEFSYYCQVQPGITGLWQISGRATLSFRDRVNLDVVYIKTWSLSKDMLILVLTIPAVFSQKGAF